MLKNRNDLGKITVLVVDDLAMNRKVATYALSDCEVLEAADSISALQQLLEHDAVDVILLDIMMPGMSGYELCQKIKAHPRWRLIPVIMLTALDGVESRVNALQAGADDFITRPCDVYDALTSDRLYREKISKTEALNYIRAKSGIDFDPDLVPIFALMIQDYN
jgi:response regulator RpfG family c-di-GMP phosphodiesterase